MNNKFKEKFRLPYDGFLLPIDLQDTEVGFSVYKNRKEQGFESLFRVFIKDDDLNKLDPVKPITVTGSYGKESKDGLIISSSEFKRKITWPIEFISEGEFFYDTTTNKLYYREQEIDGVSLLMRVDEWHTKPSRLVGGIWLRIKLTWFHYILTFIFKLIFMILAGIQYFISGEKINIFHNLTEPKNYISPKINESLNSVKSEVINFFGYEVKPWVATIYSVFHLFIYAIFYKYAYNPTWLITIFKNNFLTSVYVVVSLGLANTFLPSLLKPIDLRRLLKIIQSLHLKFSFKKVRI